MLTSAPKSKESDEMTDVSGTTVSEAGEAADDRIAVRYHDSDDARGPRRRRHPSMDSDDWDNYDEFIEEMPDEWTRAEREAYDADGDGYLEDWREYMEEVRADLAPAAENQRLWEEARLSAGERTLETGRWEEGNSPQCAVHGGFLCYCLQCGDCKEFINTGNELFCSDATIYDSDDCCDDCHNRRERHPSMDSDDWVNYNKWHDYSDDSEVEAWHDYMKEVEVPTAPIPSQVAIDAAEEHGGDPLNLCDVCGSDRGDHDVSDRNRLIPCESDGEGQEGDVEGEVLDTHNPDVAETTFPADVLQLTCYNSGDVYITDPMEGEEPKVVIDGHAIRQDAEAMMRAKYPDVTIEWSTDS